MLWGDFSCFPTGPNVVPKTRKLMPDWIPTGQKRCQKMQNWCLTMFRLDPDWFSSKKNYFPKFEHLFLKFEHLAVHRPPPLPTYPPPFLSQIRATQDRGSYKLIRGGKGPVAGAGSEAQHISTATVSFPLKIHDVWLCLIQVADAEMIRNEAADF